MIPRMSLLAFALMEYERRGWTMPDVHVRIYDWLSKTDACRDRVLMVFRGCGKSTILGVRNAHKLSQDATRQFLVQGADDDLTDDISRDTIAIIRSHEWLKDILVEPAGVRHWFTHEGYATSARTPQMRGRGILSRVTGNRADEIINDDTETAKNVETPEARTKLRRRLSEQGFILKPGGGKLWVGTPHTHDSIYEQLIQSGVEALVIPLFQHQERFEPVERVRQEFRIPFQPGPDGLWVFRGIGRQAKLLQEHSDYTFADGVVRLAEPTGALLDICAGNAWPERFHREEMAERRRECPTVNYWDQQYQLKAKPLTESRLNPDLMKPYAVEPYFREANGEFGMWLGNTRIVSMSCRWDPSSGKLKSDVSSLALIFQDEAGRRYWHRSVALKGEIAEFDERGKNIVGGQVKQIADLVREFRIPRIVLETNGAGTFAPQVLKAALKQAKLQCGVAGEPSTANKNRVILDAFEPVLSSGTLWAHESVLDGPTYDEMRDFNPAISDQPDDYIDAGARAITDTPERIGGRGLIAPESARDDWRPSAGVHDVELEF